MKKLLATVAVAALFAIGCEDKPAKPTTSGNLGSPQNVKPMKPSLEGGTAKPADKPENGKTGDGKTDADKKDKG